MTDGLALAREYQGNLPPHVREYLQQARGISGEAIDLHLLGWNGSRITIPILDRAGQFAFFKLAKGPILVDACKVIFCRKLVRGKINGESLLTPVRTQWPGIRAVIHYGRPSRIVHFL